MTISLIRCAHPTGHCGQILAASVARLPCMITTSARLLRLLSLLQSRRHWTARDLYDRLQVSGRTVRRDVDRLRELGYPIHASPGLGGGYSIRPGSAMPPVLLEDDE